MGVKVQTIDSVEKLKLELQKQPGLVVLYGGKDCQVCHALKPKLVAAISERFPMMQLRYLDCHQPTALCAQNGVMSLPTVQVYFEGQKSFEAVRTFSVARVLAAIERPYQMLFN